MKFWRCFFYLIIISVISFFVGRILPKRWFHADLFPFQSYRFEKGGRIYDKLHIRKWQNKVPDMSKHFALIMPSKSISTDVVEKLPRMIQETCVAEWIHGMNCLMGLYCLRIYPGAGGKLIAVLYAFVFNVPYMLIQRYNRPRLIRLAKCLQEHDKFQVKFHTKGEIEADENADSELQHRGRAQLLCKSH